jgi:GNAT superfamily N-acetyltransferase
MISARPLTPGDWPVVERLFGPNGACGGCWCMHWRVERGGKLWEEVKGERNRAAFATLVEAGQVDAVLAFAADEPVGWCTFGPRGGFPRLLRSKVLRREAPPDAWSILCFYIPARWRRRGVATLLLRAATARAFALGAREVEGFPVVPQGPAAPVPAAFAWTGVPRLFAANGFRPLERPGASRPIFVKRRENRA